MCHGVLRTLSPVMALAACYESILDLHERDPGNTAVGPDRAQAARAQRSDNGREPEPVFLIASVHERPE